MMRHIFGFLLLLLGVAGECQIALAQSPGTFTATGGMTAPRSGHTATLLANGKVLIAGGEAGFTPLSTAELYDPVSGTFTPTGDMRAPRSLHTATLLPDGRVLIAGGSPVIPTNGAEIYDPSTGTFAATGDMIFGRACQQATLLGNGKVLILGGNGANDRVPDAELYDPAAGTFAPAGTYASDTSGFNGCQGAVSALLPDGRVSIIWEKADAEIYDPDTSSFTPTRKPIALSYSDGLPTATLLMNGKVLVAGGADDSGIHASAELYDSLIGNFTATGDMTTGRTVHTATLLPDGTVLMAGSSLSYGGALASTELYDPVAGTFSVTGTMITAHQGEGHTATLLNNGRVLIAGANVNPLSSTAELYTPHVLVSAPVLFSLSGDGRGQGAIWDATTGQIPSPASPAITGEVLSMYTTSLVDGGAIPPQVSIGGGLAEVLFFGNAPTYPGYNQVNFRVPAGIAPGSAVPVRLTYLGRPSNAVNIGVQ
jgi:hypothetical protein